MRKCAQRPHCRSPQFLPAMEIDSRQPTVRRMFIVDRRPTVRTAFARVEHSVFEVPAIVFPPQLGFPQWLARGSLVRAHDGAQFLVLQIVPIEAWYLPRPLIEVHHCRRVE